MAGSPQVPKSVRAAQALFYLNTATWVILGVWSLLRIANGSPVGPITAAIIAILMFGNAAAMLLCSFGLGKQQARYFTLALVVLIVNIVLTVTDEFGLWDFITLVLDIVLLVLLVVTRKRYFHPV